MRSMKGGNDALTKMNEIHRRGEIQDKICGKVSEVVIVHSIATEPLDNNFLNIALPPLLLHD